MADKLEIFHSMSGCSLSELQTILQVVTEHQAISSKSTDRISSVFSDITESLQISASRTRGLLILQCVLRSSAVNEHVLSEKGPTWMTLIVSALKAPKDQSLAYTVIRSLLEKCSNVHELDRAVITASLQDLVQSFSRCSPQSHIPALRCLETLLNRFSKATGAQKNPIEKFLIKFLDSRYKREVIYAAKCAHLLQQVRGGGEQGVNHKTAWKQQLEQLLQSASAILSELYSQTADNYELNSIDYFNTGKEQNENTKLEQSKMMGPLQTALRDIAIIQEAEEQTGDSGGNPVIKKAIQLAIRLENVLVFVQAMLVDPFPVHKRINCRSILSVLIRCQSAASACPSPAGMESSLHCAMLDTLRALTHCLKGNIIPYSSLLMRMGLQTLEWSKTQDNTSGIIKPFKSVRKASYSMLSTILRCVQTTQLPTQQGDVSYEDRVIQNILEDVVPHKATMQLTVKTNSGGPVKGMSKKARRKMTMSQLESSSISGNSADALDSGNNCLNSDLTLAALDCLDSLFVASGNFFKASTYQIIQENLIKMLYTSQSPPAVKKALFHTLLMVQQFSSSASPSPLAHCINLFSRGQQAPSFKVSSFTHTALHASLSSVRGYAPPIIIPKSVQQSDNTISNGALEQNNTESRLPNGDVIEVGDSVDSEISFQEEASEDGNEFANAKKRKRSLDKSLIQIIDTSSTLPLKKRAKTIVSKNTAESVIEMQEISDSSGYEDNADETIVVDGNVSDDVLIMDDENSNGEDGSSCIEDIDNTLMEENGTRKLQQDLLKISESSESQAECPISAAEKHDETGNSENVTKLNGVRENTEQSMENRVGEKHINIELKEKGEVSIEEMLGSFVDEVNENMK